MKIHELKVHPPYFDDILFNNKRFEVRINDRDFQVGDICHLKEWNFKTEKFSPKETLKIEIIYLLQGGHFGIQEGYVVFGFRRFDKLNPVII